MPRSYATPLAFKAALEQRLRASSRDGLDLDRRRQLLVFQRFLARAAIQLGDAITLKGGLSLELRLERARSTVDVDLRATGRPDHVLAQLRTAGQRDLGDYMTFELQPDPMHPEIRNEGMRYDGVRFRVACKLGGRIYGRQSFHVDVAFADPILGEPELVTTADTLAFAGIAAPRVRLYPIETHIAEKLHAYTLPRERPNTRVKDLPDLALLGSIRDIAGARIRAAIDQTFAFRSTHAVPDRLPAPPRAWSGVYARMAVEHDLPWTELDDVAVAASRFVDGALVGPSTAIWNATSRRWT